MAVSIYEKPESRELTLGQSHERLYIILGTDDEEAALVALLAKAPATSHDLVRRGCSVEPLGPYPDEDNPDTILKPGAWLGTAPYKPVSSHSVDDLALNELAVTYDTGGATQHVTQAKSTISKHAPAGKTATDHKGAIGVSGTGDGLSVEGVDIGVRQMRLTVTKCFAVAALPAPGTLHALTWTTSNGAVSFTDSRTGQTFSFDAGELLLEGVSGPVMREDSNAELTYQLAAAPNEANFGPIGDIAAFAKDGWEHVWARYRTYKDAASDTIAARPFEAYVEQVYDSADFSGLGL